MLKSWLPTAAFGALLVLLSPGASSAQRGGYSGGRGGYSGGYNGYYGGHNGYYGGHDGYYRGYGSYGYGGYGYSPYSFGPSVYVGPSASYYATPATSYYYAPPAEQAAIATFAVRVPSQAEIWFEGNKTSQTGDLRTFVSPSVPPGRSFSYDVRARWTGPDGRVVDQTRSVQFQAGQRLTVDFLRP
jgi:uncharacterized protein (TIGR03000 family)